MYSPTKKQKTDNEQATHLSCTPSQSIKELVMCSLTENSIYNQFDLHNVEPKLLTEL